jgi:hypothetical protein
MQRQQIFEKVGFDRPQVLEFDASAANLNSNGWTLFDAVMNWVVQ